MASDNLRPGLPNRSRSASTGSARNEWRQGGRHVTVLAMFLQVLIAVALAATAPLQSSLQPADDFNRLTADQLRAGIEQRHPVAYYVLAGKLFEAGVRDEAVFWFYSGQLRYRFHLAANPKLSPSGDPALFASLSDVLGQRINEYAFGDLTQLLATIDKVLDWDESTDNGFTSKTAHSAAWKDVRGGLVKMRDFVESNGEQIRAQRKQNGLENRKP